MKSHFLALPLAALAVAHDAHQIPLEDNTSMQPLSLDAIPLLGFGTWNLKTNCSQAVSWAIQTGYRHIDCAAIYGNEVEVGQGIADGLNKTGLKREQLWITSKLWNDHHGLHNVEEALDKTLGNLGVGYLDLYHMHWPVGEDIFGHKKISYADTWGGMTIQVAKGKARHIGVSNFSPQQLENLMAHTDIKPSVHQMEMHPYLQQADWLAWHERNGIHVTAYSPLAGTNPTYNKGDPVPLLENKVVHKVAERRGCTPAQVVLAWHLSRGVSVIPKSSHPERVTENWATLGCELTGEDLQKIFRLGAAHHRYNNPSKSWGLTLYEDLEDWKGQHKKDA